MSSKSSKNELQNVLELQKRILEDEIIRNILKKNNKLEEKNLDLINEFFKRIQSKKFQDSLTELDGKRKKQLALYVKSKEVIQYYLSKNIIELRNSIEESDTRTLGEFHTKKFSREPYKITADFFSILLGFWGFPHFKSSRKEDKINSKDQNIPLEKGLIQKKSVAQKSLFKKSKLQIVSFFAIALIAPLVYYFINLPKDTTQITEVSTKPELPIEKNNTIFPIKSKDSLYILVIRFYKFDNKNGGDCPGESIHTRINAIAFEKGLPVKSEYADDIVSPRDARDAEEIKEKFKPDVLIWGHTEKFNENCGKGDLCFFSIPSDSILGRSYERPIINPLKINQEYEKVNTLDIREKGELHINGKKLDSWVIGLLDLKLGEKKPEFYIIDKSLTGKELAEEYYDKGSIYLNLENFPKAIENFETSIEIYDMDKTHFKMLELYDTKRGLIDYDIRKLTTRYTYEDTYLNTYYKKLNQLYKEEFDCKEKFIENYISIIEKNPSDLNLLNDAVNSLRSDKPKLAIKYGKQLLMTKKYDLIILYYIASSHYNLFQQNPLEISYLKNAFYFEKLYIEKFHRENKTDRFDDYYPPILGYIIEIINYTNLDNKEEYFCLILNHLNFIINLYPSEAINYKNRSLVYNNLDIYEAINDLNKLIKLEPENSQNYINKALILAFNFANYFDAINILENNKNKINKNEYWETRARIHRRFNQTKLVEYDLINLNKQNDNWESLFNFYKDHGETEKALKLVSSNIEDFQGYELRSDLYLKLGEYLLALKDFSKMIEKEDKLREHYMSLSEREIENDANGYIFEEVIVISDRLSDIKCVEPVNLITNYTKRGKFNEKAGKHEMALKDFQKSIIHNSSDFSLYHSIAKNYFALGKTKLALENINKYIEHFDGYDSKHLFNASELLYQMKQYDIAKKHLKKAIEIDSLSYNSEIYNLLGIINLEQKHFKLAKNYFSEAITQDSIQYEILKKDSFKKRLVKYRNNRILSNKPLKNHKEIKSDSLLVSKYLTSL